MEFRTRKEVFLINSGKFLWFAIAALVVVTILSEVIDLDLCREDVKAVIESPDGRSQLVVYEFDCGGATTSAYTKVKVESLDPRLATKVVLVLHGKYTEELIVGQWTSDKSVQLIVDNVESINQYVPNNRASLDLDLQLVLK